MPPLAGEEPRGVERRAFHPEAAEGVEQQGEIRSRLARPPHRPHGEPSGTPLGVLAHQRGEGPARPDLDHDAVRIAQQLGHRLGEAHRLDHVARPVAGVLEVGGGDPGAGDVRQVGDLRRPYPRRTGKLGKRRRRRLHHRRVEGVGGGQPEAGHPSLGQPALELRHRLLGAADDAEVRAVGGGDGEALVEQRPHLGFRGRHGEHGAGGELLDQLRAPRHQGQGVLQGEDAGEAGGHVLAQAVADHRLRLDAPGHQQPRQRVLDGEEDGLRVLGAGEPAGGLVRGLATAQQGAQIGLALGSSGAY